MSEKLIEGKKMTLSDVAEGSIGPGPRIERGEITEVEVDAFAELLKSDEFYSPATPEHGLNAAGGTYSLVVAEALRNPAALAQAGDMAALARNIFISLRARGALIGDHCDTHASGENCGCGALDKMNRVFEFIAENAGEIKKFAAGLGVDIKNMDDIAANAGAIVEQGLIPSGRTMLSEVDKTGKVVTLQDEHNEVVLAVNVVPGTSLDKNKLHKKYPDGKLEAFEVDAWALDQEAIVYNIAVAHVLANKSLRVVVHSEGQPYEGDDVLMAPNRCVDGRYED